MYRTVIKRLIDLTISFLAIILLLLPMLLIALVIFIDDPGPVIFTQKRFGQNRKLFKILKFRTMKIDTPDIPTDKMVDAGKYVTRVGKFLRKTSLDELPQLLNILVGQMSFVGPRPALWNQDKLIELREKVGANAVRPGLSGWAQINGRDNISEKKKAELDGEYVKRLSFLFDLKCFLGTFVKALVGDGVAE